MTDNMFRNIKGRIATLMVAVMLFHGNALGVGDSPISGLRLTSNANGGNYDFTNLNNVAAQSFTLGGTTITNWSFSVNWGGIAGTITNQTDLWSYLSWVQSTSNTVNNGTQNWNNAWSWVQANSNKVNNAITNEVDPAFVAWTNSFNIDAVFTNNASFTMTTAQGVTTNFGLTNLNWNVPFVVRGRLYIPNTNNITVSAPFSQNVRLTFREQQARSGGQALYMADVSQVGQLIASNAAVGATNVWVWDGTSFAGTNLVYLGGVDSTPEFNRVQSVSGNNLILMYTNLYAHSGTTNIISKVREFGGFKTYDTSGTKTMWGSIDINSATNIWFNLDVEYSH